MSTSKPRITITLEPHSYEVLSRLAKLGGQSMSSVVVEVLDLAVPSFERVVAVLERAQTAGDEVKAGMRAAILRAERELVPAMMDQAGQVDFLLAGFSSGGEPAQAGSDQTQRAGQTQAAGLMGLGAAALPSVPPPEGGTRGGSTPVPVTRGSGRKSGARNGSL